MRELVAIGRNREEEGVAVTVRLGTKVRRSVQSRTIRIIGNKVRCWMVSCTTRPCVARSMIRAFVCRQVGA